MTHPLSQANHFFSTIQDLPAQIIAHPYFIDRLDISALTDAIRDEKATVLFAHRNARQNAVTISDNHGHINVFTVMASDDGHLSFVNENLLSPAIVCSNFAEFLAIQKKQFAACAYISSQAATQQNSPNNFDAIKANAEKKVAVLLEKGEAISETALMVLETTTWQDASQHFICPLNKQIMTGPVMSSEGISYEAMPLAKHCQAEIVKNQSMTLGDPQGKLWVSSPKMGAYLSEITPDSRWDTYEGKPFYTDYYIFDEVLKYFISKWIKSCYPDALTRYKQVKEALIKVGQLETIAAEKLINAIDQVHAVKAAVAGKPLDLSYDNYVVYSDNIQFLKDTLTTAQKRGANSYNARLAIAEAEAAKIPLESAIEIYHEKYLEFNDFLSILQKVTDAALSSAAEIEENFECPVSAERLTKAVTTQAGHTYEKSVIEKWFSMNNTDPFTRAVTSKELVPNHFITKAIAAWEFPDRYTRMRNLINCPLSGRPMVQPILCKDGITYDESSLASAEAPPKKHSKNLSAKKIILAMNPAPSALLIEAPSAPPLESQSVPPIESQSVLPILPSMPLIAPPSAPPLEPQPVPLAELLSMSALELPSAPPVAAVKGSFFYSAAYPPFVPEVLDQAALLAPYLRSYESPG